VTQLIELADRGGVRDQFLGLPCLFVRSVLGLPCLFVRSVLGLPCLLCVVSFRAALLACVVSFRAALLACAISFRAALLALRGQFFGLPCMGGRRVYMLPRKRLQRRGVPLPLNIAFAARGGGAAGAKQKAENSDRVFWSDVCMRKAVPMYA
jgi:hypothetical protein